MEKYSDEQIEVLLRAEIERIKFPSFRKTFFEKLPDFIAEIRKKLEMMSITYAEDQIDLPTLVKGTIKNRTVNILARNSYRGYVRLMKKQGYKPLSFGEFLSKNRDRTAPIRVKFDRIQQQGIEINSIVFDRKRGEPVEVVGIKADCGLACKNFAGKRVRQSASPFYFQPISIEEAFQVLKRN